MNYYRIKHDESVWGEIRKFKKGFSGDIYPAVRPFFPRPFGGAAMYQITPEWYHAVVDWQEDEINLRKVNGGWINRQGGWKTGRPVPLTWKGKPKIKIKSLSGIGNIAAGILNNGSVKVYGFKLWDKPSGNYFTDPVRWTKFSSIDKRNGKLGLVGNDCYFPILSNGDIYMPLKFLEPFPELPFTGMAYGNSIREYPTMNADKVGSLAYGDEFTISEYHFWGSDVWGKTEDGWICLCYANIRRWPASYLTSWAMDTKPPIGTYWRTEEPLSNFTG